MRIRIRRTADRGPRTARQVSGGVVGPARARARRRHAIRPAARRSDRQGRRCRRLDRASCRLSAVGGPTRPRPSPTRAGRRSRRGRSPRWPPIATLPLIDADALRIEVVELPRVASRPFGPRFGTLVHTTLATVPLDADEGDGSARRGHAGADPAGVRSRSGRGGLCRRRSRDRGAAASAVRPGPRRECRRTLLSRAAADLAGSGRHADRRHDRPGVRGRQHRRGPSWSCWTSRPTASWTSKWSAIGVSWRSTASALTALQGARPAGSSCECDTSVARALAEC